MSSTMLAVVKPEAAPGAEIREVKIPAFGRTDVLVKVKVASICGTDLHIYNWDRWAQNRIHPPLIPGHEFCGEVAAFGDEVTSVKEGDFVSAEMHVACGKCLQCRTGEAHICQNVKIIGVDANGAFAEYVVIPESNIWKLDPAIPQEYASILDPLGNAVHTVLAGEIAAKTVAITGCGPIGSVFDCRGARPWARPAVFAIEVNEHRAAHCARDEGRLRAQSLERRCECHRDGEEQAGSASMWCSKWRGIPTRFEPPSTSCGAAEEFPFSA